MRRSHFREFIYLPVSFFIGLTACTEQANKTVEVIVADSAVIKPVESSSTDTIQSALTGNGIVSGNIPPDSILAFAKTLLGIPYLYASTDPAKGFDCSGFITYVFNHFNMTVPRSSVDFTNYGKEITVAAAKPGDLILFTGTDSTIRIVGHMGIIESRKADTIYFIHSSSGKSKGVVITPLGNYYQSRFVKVVRILPDSFFK